jgi:hypothetical protein
MAATAISPPEAGADCDYDALLQWLVEAETAEEARRIELAFGSLLLSRNYDAQPREYQVLFRSGPNQSTGHEAISALIHDDLEKRLAACGPAPSPLVLCQRSIGGLEYRL